MKKVCSKCKIEQDYNCYYKHKKFKDGLHPYCKSCFKEYYKNNKESRDEYDREYRVKNREYVLDRNRKYYHDNKEKQLKLNKIWRKNNHSKKLEYDRKWRKNNTDKTMNYKHIRRARERNVLFESGISKTDILKEQGGKCASCKSSGDEIEWHLDHIMPISRGGSHARDNVQILCRDCNLSKYNKTMEEWKG